MTLNTIWSVLQRKSPQNFGALVYVCTQTLFISQASKKCYSDQPS